MRLNYKIQVNSIADQNIGVAIGEDAKTFRNLLFLNKTGKYIIELLKNDVSRQEILQNIQAHFDGDETQVEKEVNLFLKKLIEIGLVDDDII